MLTVDDLGEVHDEFADTTMISEINGKPALSVAVERTAQEDLIAIVEEVREYVKTANLPPGYSLKLWKDQSVDVRDRMQLLSSNGLQGLILVFITLAIFLEFVWRSGCLGHSDFDVWCLYRAVLYGTDSEHAFDVRLFDGVGDCRG